MQQAATPANRILEIATNLGIGYISYFFLTITILGLAFPFAFTAIDPVTGGLPIPIRAALDFFNINVAGHYSFNLNDIFHAIGFLALISWGVGSIIRFTTKKITGRPLQLNHWVGFLISSALIFAVIIMAFIHSKTATFANPDQQDDTRTFLLIGGAVAYVSFCLRALVLFLGRKIISKIKTPINYT